jgi:hypothetical protein
LVEARSKLKPLGGRNKPAGMFRGEPGADEPTFEVERRERGPRTEVEPRGRTIGEFVRGDPGDSPTPGGRAPRGIGGLPILRRVGEGVDVAAGQVVATGTSTRCASSPSRFE